MNDFTYTKGKLYKNNMSQPLHRPQLLPDPNEGKECPFCFSMKEPSITLNDGGSVICSTCNRKYHWCIDGKSFGSEKGPSDCLKCRPVRMI